jgi:hypothetical protein
MQSPSKFVLNETMARFPVPRRLAFDPSGSALLADDIDFFLKTEIKGRKISGGTNRGLAKRVKSQCRF